MVSFGYNSGVGVLLLLTWANQATASKRHKVVTLPHERDVIQLKSCESNAYLGVSCAPDYQDSSCTVSATHTFGSSNSHLEVSYLHLASGPLTLSVPRRGSHRRLSMGFEASGKAFMRDWTHHQKRHPPSNISLELGGWPTAGAIGNVAAGPYYRLYLVDDLYPHHPLALVGVNQDGIVSLYSLDEEQESSTFVRPPTLFLLNIVKRERPSVGRRHVR